MSDSVRPTSQNQGRLISTLLDCPIESGIAFVINQFGIDPQLQQHRYHVTMPSGSREMEDA